MCKTELRNLQSLFGLREPAVCLVHSYLSLHNTLNNIASFIKDYFKRGFNSVVKPKPKQSVWPITQDIDNPVNQSKVEANTCSWREARENVCEPVTIGFGFTSD